MSLPSPRTSAPPTVTVDDALAYVDDTVSLRTPVERALAAEVHRLRAAASWDGTCLPVRNGELADTVGAV